MPCHALPYREMELRRQDRNKQQKIWSRFYDLFYSELIEEKNASVLLQVQTNYPIPARYVEIIIKGLLVAAAAAVVALLK